jgi:DeoR/GlpR family transcriptional regulator of sugar metabolism
VDSNARVCDLSHVDTLITDSGAQAAHRVEFNQRGIRVMIAGQVLNGGRE